MLILDFEFWNVRFEFFILTLELFIFTSNFIKNVNNSAFKKLHQISIRKFENYRSRLLKQFFRGDNGALDLLSNIKNIPDFRINFKYPYFAITSMFRRKYIYLFEKFYYKESRFRMQSLKAKKSDYNNSYW